MLVKWWLLALRACWNTLRPGETVRFQATAVPLEGAPAEPVIAADARTAVGR